MRRITPHALPAKDKRPAKTRARHERRKDDEHQRGEVVDGLQRRDLACDLEGG